MPLSEGWRTGLIGGAWLVAAAWMHRAANMVWGMPALPDLTGPDWEIGPGLMPRLAVVVPAKDEAESLEATLETLRQQEYPYLQVVVVDDRSTDATGTIADSFAERYPERFEALHITDLPEGWLGKTWAMDAGMRQCPEAEYVLFTDADILFSPSVLWRALALAEVSRADHVVVLPSPLARTWGEGVLLGFCQLMSLWATRLWKVADPRARRDVMGVGAFNLVRRSSFEELGGWFPQRMVVLEDLTVGRRMKAAGMRTQVGTAPGLVLVHWATGVRGIVRVTTKNLFSSVNFRPALLLAGCMTIVMLCLAPLAGLFWLPTLLPCVLTLLSIFVCYRMWGEVTGIDERNFFAYPLGAGLLLWAMVRSMVVVMVKRGVLWRGTFYPLAALQRENGPFRWEKEAAAMRARQRRETPSPLRRWVDARKARRKGKPHAGR
ncbi:MAG: glycosyltransferase family 2 protein [Micavibrio sp.]|nr:glycosyltransferase family 2 protein [Micavibrio sp.]